MEPKLTDPKALATCVRQLLETARLLEQIAGVLLPMGKDTETLWSVVHHASEDITNRCISCPGVRIAVFPLEDKEAK